MPKQEAVTYERLETLAKLMDDQFKIGGFTFGLNFIIDLIPEIGDFITTTIALYIFSAALKYKIPKNVLFRMVVNIALYFLVGLIPWLGDIFGTWWKPNRRNLELLKKSLASIS